LLFILVYLTATAITKPPDSFSHLAIKAIIDEYFAENVYEIEIINFGVRNGRGEKTSDELLRLGNPSMPMRISRDDREHPESVDFKLKTPSILLFDSPENFNQTQSRIVFQHGHLISHPHLVLVHNATIDDLQVAADKNHTIDKTIFLVNETRHSISLATSFLFTPEACYTNRFKIINRFTKLQNRWENSNFFVEKYSNFHGCPLETFFKKKEDLFSEILNYTHGKLNLNIQINETISMRNTALTIETLQNFNAYAVFQFSQKIFIPPGELYGDYEKMILPFDPLTWIAIGLLIFVSFFAILAIKWLSPNHQEIYFGTNNRSPLMNFISIMINGGQTTNFSDNAPRIFLLTFIFWSLIFR
jgi:hypothetical protein